MEHLLAVSTWQRFIAAGLSVLLVSCSATHHSLHEPSSAQELSRYLLSIEQAPNGEVAHAWRPIGDLDLSQYAHRASPRDGTGPIVRASFNRDCESERDACESMCKASLRGRNWSHASAGSKAELCRERCRPAYQDCSKLREQAEAVRLPDMAKALDWLKRHRQELEVGAVVVIAGVAFVVIVSASAGGALLLAPVVLVVSSESATEPRFAAMEP